MKKVLLSCFACSPYRGSEAMCSWKTALALSENNKVYVLTRKNNKNDIDRYLSENPQSNNLNFIYSDSSIGRKLFEKCSKFYFLYYLLWQKEAYKYLKNNELLDDIDVIHHITLGDFREIGYLWKLPKPFIFGPVGGGQVAPKSLSKYLKGHKINELFRKIINYLFINSIRYKKAIEKTKYILCANYETREYLCKFHSKYSEKILIMTENGLSEDQFLKEEKVFNKDIKFMWCGRLIYRKGLQIILDCIKNLDMGISFDIYGEGPERKKLLKFINNNNLNDIKLLNPLSYKEILDKYREYDVFIFPSIRETTGTVLLEAMANKLPVITFNQNGASLLVANKELLLDVNRPLCEIKLDLKDILNRIVNGETDLKKISEENFENALSLLWRNKIKNIIDLYE